MNQTINKYLYSHFSISILFFLISAFYGWLLRLQHILPVSLFDYTNILQAHSHVTFLGWGFLASISLISAVFLDNKILNDKTLKYSYRLMVFCLGALLVSFPLQGYKVFSISFLTLFLIASYVYLAFLLKKLKKDESISLKYIRTGIFYYFLSSVAIWTVPIFIVKIGKGEMYQNAIYFYLHFLYNGFFVFILFGLLIKFFESRKISFPKRNAKLFFYLTHIACVPAYALSLMWSDVSNVVVGVAIVAASIQVASLLYLTSILKKMWDYIPQKPTLRLLLFVVSFAYYVKIIIQFFGSFPFVADVAISFKPFMIIAYIHLFTLGFLSLFLFLLMYIHTKFKLSKLGLFLFTLGILLSEILLFTQGILLYSTKSGIVNYSMFLFVASSTILVGLLLIFINHFRTKKYQLSS